MRITCNWNESRKKDNSDHIKTYANTAAIATTIFVINFSLSQRCISYAVRSLPLFCNNWWTFIINSEPSLLQTFLTIRLAPLQNPLQHAHIVFVPSRCPNISAEIQHSWYNEIFLPPFFPQLMSCGTKVVDHSLL